MEKFKRICREIMYDGIKLNFCRDTLIAPDGKQIYFDHIEHPGAAAVLPVTDDGRIILVSQWRNAVERFTYELPAGGREPGEDLYEVAKRELEEETGYRSDDLEYLMTINTDIAFCDEIVEIYIARNLKPSKQNLDPEEYVDVSFWTLDELVSKIYAGEIRDCKTLSAILAYKDKYLK